MNKGTELWPVKIPMSPCDGVEGSQIYDVLSCKQVAHARLRKAIERIQDEKEPALATLLACLATVHSYVLVKHHVQMENHLGAARLLIRVCNNISRFEKHAVQILTSAVIECQRADLLQSAFDLATKLMQPEHRESLQKMGAHKRKIEGLVRICQPKLLLIKC
jgi:WD repeat-containing protein 19